MKEIKIFGDKKILIRPLTANDLKTPEKFRDFINSLVADNAKILVNTKKSKQEELEWLKGRTKQVKNKKYVCLVAEYQKSIVGSASVEGERERKNHIGEFSISVKNGFRGIGLGKHLAKMVIQLARKELKPRVKIIELGVYEGNTPAINLYRKLGFKRVAKIPNHIQYNGNLISETIMHLE